MRLFSVFLFSLLFSIGAGAQFRCQSVFRDKTGIEIVESLNLKYDSIFFQSEVSEQIQKRSFPGIRSFKLFQLRRQLKDLGKNGDGFDAFDLDRFVYKLDRLAFADLATKDQLVAEKLSKNDLLLLSQVRRTLLKDGVAKHFGIDQYAPKSGIFKKSYDTFMQAFSWKYWRWTQSPIMMPKLVGLSIPLELAQKIAWEGLDKHRTEVEKYFPAVKNRQTFNQLSKLYNYLVLTSMLTVVPYYTHEYYVEQIKLGEARAEQMLIPLVKTTEEMSKIDYAEQKELAALEKYVQTIETKENRKMTEAEIELVRIRIHQINSGK